MNGKLQLNPESVDVINDQAYLLTKLSQDLAKDAVMSGVRAHPVWENTRT